MDVKNQTRIELARGGVIINTKKIGGIQFGIPPETIKDCMNLGITIPNHFVFPKELFDREKGVNVAEAEFPAYFNFFILNKVVQFICTKEQEAKIREVFQETLLGPRTFDLRQEFTPDFPEDAIPILEKECAAIRTFHSIDELFTFVHFDAKGVAVLQEGLIIKDLGDCFQVIEDGQEVARAPCKVKLPEHIWQKSFLSRSQPPFEPPLFGVTILGSGHGFDPSHRTSGFVLWINRRGSMVDPPLNSRAVLQQSGVPSRLIDSVIITHCHADHDQGTLQKLLEETQITLITTSTILGSFLRKYSALTGLTEDFLRRLFIFRPCIMGEPMRVNGGEIRFFYSIHTIPCIGFEVYYGGKSIYFSGDTCYDPQLIKKMHSEGSLLQGRADKWLSFQWQHNLILHEAGVPPIHTPVSILAALSEDIKKRLYLIHTSKKSVPPESNLRIAPEGVSGTITLDVRPHVHAEAIELLKVVDSIDMFRVFTLAQARELLQNAMPKHYSANSIIIEKDTNGSEFFIITSGIVFLTDGTWKKNLVSGDYFGEMSLVTGGKRSATAVAKTDVELVAFGKEDFHSILRGNTETIEFLKNLSQRRQEPSWELISINSIFYRMTNAQKTRLQAILKKRIVKTGEKIWSKGDPAEFAYFVAQGTVSFREKPELRPFVAGACLGEFDSLLSGGDLRTTLVADAEGWGYTIARLDFLTFCERNPGVRLSFFGANFADALKPDQIKEEESIDGCPF